MKDFLPVSGLVTQEIMRKKERKRKENERLFIPLRNKGMR